MFIQVHGVNRPRVDEDQLRCETWMDITVRSENKALPESGAQRSDAVKATFIRVFATLAGCSQLVWSV